MERTPPTPHADRRRSLIRLGLPALLVFLASTLVQPGGPAGRHALAAQPAEGITVYAGRSETLVGPLLDRFRGDSGIPIQVRYAGTTALAAAILEEGDNSPADVFFAQDAGALGALAQSDRLARLPDYILSRVDARFRARGDNWVGVSGRARVIAYNPEFVGEENLPDSVLGFTHPVWRGRVGWAPSNASFQAFVTALRMTAGDDVTRQWLIDMRANDTRSYASNTAIVLAVASGEIHAGIPNHYYLHAIQKDQGPISARNYHPRAGGVDAMVNVAGAGILRTSRNPAGAQRFVDYLLSQSAQEYFARETFEYPLVQGIPAAPNVTPISELRVPDFDLGSLADLNGTLRLLRETNVL